MWNWVAVKNGDNVKINRWAVQLAKILIATRWSWHLWIWTSVPLSRKFVDSSIRGARPRALQGGVRPPAAGGRHPRLLHHDGHPDIRCRQAHIISRLFMKYLDLLKSSISAHHEHEEGEERGYIRSLLYWHQWEISMNCRTHQDKKIRWTVCVE